MLVEPLERVIVELARLPGIGRKTAQRLALHLLKAPEARARALADSLVELKERVGSCRRCFFIAEGDTCSICDDPRRDGSLLCVVEEAANVLVLERSSAFRGLYHVLGGALSPLKDVGPDDLEIDSLMARAREGGFREIVLATNPNVEGEATAVYLARMLKPLGLTLSRLAQGLPAGGELEYTDELTLQRAFEGRREY